MSMVPSPKSRGGKRKPPLPFDWHVKAGLDLRAVRETVFRLRVEIGQAAPVASKHRRQAVKALDAIDQLRCELDNVVFREHPEQATTTVYYGGPAAQ